MKNHYLIFALLFSVTVSFAQTLEDDRLALIALYNSSGGTTWFNKAGWTVPGAPGDNPCGWAGVSCTGVRVTGLSLPDNGMSGSLPPEIGNLTELDYLDLSGTGSIEFGGGLENSIPVELGNLKKLEYLNIGGHFFDATNVGVLGSLTKLKYLAITPHWPIPEEFGNLVNLEHLNLSVFDGSGMSGMGKAGNMPAFLGNLTKLRTLNMQLAGITGNIPVEIGNLVNLELLDLSRNYDLVGNIPIQLTELSQLKSLLISDTRISGNIPIELGNMMNLEVLVLSGN